MKLYHITLTTGHARWSPRSEVAADIMTLLRPLVLECERDGSAEFPSPTGLAKLWRIQGNSRHNAVWAIGPPDGHSRHAWVTFALSMKSRPGAALWRSLHQTGWGSALATSVDSVPPEPWLGVIVHPTTLFHPDALDWLADAERCIAWAWIDTIWSQHDR